MLGNLIYLTGGKGDDDEEEEDIKRTSGLKIFLIIFGILILLGGGYFVYTYILNTPSLDGTWTSTLPVQTTLIIGGNTISVLAGNSAGYLNGTIDYTKKTITTNNIINTYEYNFSIFSFAETLTITQPTQPPIISVFTKPLIPPTKSINGTWILSVPSTSISLTINGTIISAVDGTIPPPNTTTATFINNIITSQGPLLQGNPTVLYNSINDTLLFITLISEQPKVFTRQPAATK